MTDHPNKPNSELPKGPVSQWFSDWMRVDPIGTLACAAIFALGFVQSLVSTDWSVATIMTWSLLPMIFIGCYFWFYRKSRLLTSLGFEEVKHAKATYINYQVPTLISIIFILGFVLGRMA